MIFIRKPSSLAQGDASRASPATDAAGRSEEAADEVPVAERGCESSQAAALTLAAAFLGSLHRALHRVLRHAW